MLESFDLLNLSGPYVNRYILAVVRVLGALSLNPLLGSPRVPLAARIGLALFLTFVLFPPGGPATGTVTIGVQELAGELLIGLLAGFAVALLFAAAQFAASLIASNAGFGLASAFDPHLDLGGMGLERFFSTLALLLFVQTNGHHLFLVGLHDLFQISEVGAVTFQPATIDRLATMTASLFVAAVKMALPALAALMMADLGLAVLSRIAPQFNLFVLGLPIKVAVGLLALLLSLPVVFPRLMALFRGLPASMLGLAG